MDDAPAREIRRLQRCISDLVSILGLPGIWTGVEPQRIVSELADALLPMMGLDAVYVRLDEPFSSCLAHSQAAGSPPAELLGLFDRSSFESFPNRLVLQLGIHGELGLLVAGSQREDFPTEAERLVLRVAANQATIALERARLAAAVAGELQNEIARKAAITDSALDCIVSIDHLGRITEFNLAAESTFGYTKDEVLGRELADVIIPPELREDHRRGLQRYLTTGEAVVLGKRIEMTAMRSNGHRFPVELTVTRLPSVGPPAFTGFLRDVTARKQTEDMLAELRAQLAHTSRVTTLGALAASIAHEVNQPLAGIITNAGTCLRMLDADPPNLDGARETATRTARDGHRAADVIKRLRALFSKEVAAEPLDLTEATREVLALTAGELHRNAVTLELELSDDLPRVNGDRVQLQQVVLNLIVNAVEAMASIERHPRTLLVRTECEGDELVRLTVKDSGPGFPPDGSDRVFDAFFTTKDSGMGMGLSVSRTIVESHRGRLWAESEPNQGATFAFSIPCR